MLAQYRDCLRLLRRGTELPLVKKELRGQAHKLLYALRKPLLPLGDCRKTALLLQRRDQLLPHGIALVPQEREALGVA